MSPRLARTVAPILSLLTLSLLAGPCLAGVSARYGPEDPHLDGLFSRCQAPYDAYMQVLAANVTPEIVDFSLRNFVESLKSPAHWSAAELAERQAISDRAVAAPAQSLSADPAAPAAAQLSQCIVGAERLSRQKP